MPQCQYNMQSLLQEHIRDLLRRSKLRDDVARKASQDFLANVSAEDMQAAELRRKRRTLQHEVDSATNSCKWLAVLIQENSMSPSTEATVKCDSCGAKTPWVGSGPVVCVCGKVRQCAAAVPFSIPLTDMVGQLIPGCRPRTAWWERVAEVRQKRFEDFTKQGDLSCLRDVMLLNSLLLCALIDQKDAVENCIAAHPVLQQFLREESPLCVTRECKEFCVTRECKEEREGGLVLSNEGTVPDFRDE